MSKILTLKGFIKDKKIVQISRYHDNLERNIERGKLKLKFSLLIITHLCTSTREL